MTDEDTAEHLTNDINSSRITPSTVSLSADIDIPTPTQDLSVALGNTPILNPPALKLLAENNASIMGITQ